MKVPIRWLKDYVDFDLSLGALVNRLALAGLEVSGINHWGLPAPEGLRLGAEDPYPVWDKDKIIIGLVTKVDKHPDADRLKLPTVEYGSGRSITMVTGAPNLSVGDTGQKVILALSGSVLFDGHATPKVLKELKPGKIRGITSDGMVCSGFELGISEDHDGIIILEDDAPIGMPLADYFGDSIIEIDILPNKARCLSMIGVAREVAAMTGGKLKPFEHKPHTFGPAITGKVKASIQDTSACHRYTASLIENIKVAPSPAFLKRRLHQAGMRPINNIVDITNYVMLEQGQPLHAFDYDVLCSRAKSKTPEIVVRFATKGEKIKTLDGLDRELSTETLIIADTLGPIAIAGLMGGAETEVTESTSRVLLESANFDFLAIRKAMKSLALPSEAATRFSKGIHPDQVIGGANRALQLMQEFAHGLPAEGRIDCYPSPKPLQVIDFSLAEAKRILGIAIPIEECTKLLTSLEFKVEKVSNEMLRVTAPTHRLDIQVGVADLLEDIARLYGYDKFPETSLSEQLPPVLIDPELDFERKIKDTLVHLGLQETIAYSLTSPEAESAFLESAMPAYVTLLNPISSERTVMRQSLMASIVSLTQANLKHTECVKFFEVGKVYQKVSGQTLPLEPYKLAIAICGPRNKPFWVEDSSGKNNLNFYDLKGIVEGLTSGVHLEKVSFKPGNHPALHPGKCAALMIHDKVAGMFGVLHPKLASTLGLDNHEIIAAEFDMQTLASGLPVRYLSKPVSRFPAALRDIAVVVDQAITGQTVTAEIQAAVGNVLKVARLFDIYQGDRVPAGTKSLAFALSYQADDRTLNDKEVDKLHKKIEDRLKHVLKAQIRGKEV